MIMLSRIKNKLRILFPANTKKVFSTIFHKNAWGSEESFSGPGSTLAYTTRFRRLLPSILHSLEIKTLLDAPCGDCNWISRVDLSGIDYTGADIVGKIIEINKTKFPDKKFIIADITKDKLPKTDAVICRDCFIHLQNRQVIKSIKNFKRCGIKYILTNTYPVNENIAIPTGYYRPVNLELSPFNLPAPLKMIDDYAQGTTVRFLGCWLLEEINL